MLLILGLAACSQDLAIGKNDGDTAGVDETEDTTMWDGATLEVLTPTSNSFLPYEHAAEFQAVVYDAAGNPTDFADIQWASDVDAQWVHTAAVFADATLDVGTHALTAVALLPNGDRLVYTVGGVLVQSEYAGIYVGNLAVNVAMDYEDATYEVGCSGAATFVVDAEGDAVVGSAGCVVSLLSYTLDMSYDIELDNDRGELEGEALADLTLVEYGFATVGELDEDGQLEGAFSDDVYGFAQIDGIFTAERISRDITGN